MPKKKGALKKRVSKPKTARKVYRRTKTSSSDGKIEQVLVENFVSLQKVMTHLSGKFDSLAAQISKLLELFEISAKTMAKKDFELGGNKRDEEMVKKIDTLLEQNKIIARGLTLLHEPENKIESSPSLIKKQTTKIPIQHSIQKPLQKSPIPKFMQKQPLQEPVPSPIEKMPFREYGEHNFDEQGDYQKSRPLNNSSDSIFGATSPKSREKQKKSYNSKGFEI